MGLCHANTHTHTQTYTYTERHASNRVRIIQSSESALPKWTRPNFGQVPTLSTFGDLALFRPSFINKNHLFKFTLCTIDCASKVSGKKRKSTANSTNIRFCPSVWTLCPHFDGTLWLISSVMFKSKHTVYLPISFEFQAHHLMISRSFHGHLMFSIQTLAGWCH